MTIISSKLYSALKQANISEESAIAASEEVANFNNDITEIKTSLKFIMSLNIAMFCTLIATLCTMVILFAK